MIYLVNGRQYVLSYNELREDYIKYSKMKSAEFFSDIPKLLHFICIVSYIKEVPAEHLVSDEGIIHQLVHLMSFETHKFLMPRIRRNVRKQFKIWCKLD